MTEIKRHLKQRYLKRRLARNSYTVDPHRVATAMVIRLAQDGAPECGPGSGPSRPPAAVSEFVHRIRGVDPDERNTCATQFGEQRLSSDLHSGRGRWLGTNDEQRLLSHLCHQ